VGGAYELRVVRCSDFWGLFTGIKLPVVYFAPILDGGQVAVPVWPVRRRRSGIEIRKVTLLGITMA